MAPTSLGEQVVAALIRAYCLFAPLGAVAALWCWRRPARRLGAAALLALAWQCPTLLALHWLAMRLGWWQFQAQGGLFFGMPVDLYVGWAVLWGPLPVLAFPRRRSWLVAIGALGLDLLVMPAVSPLVKLANSWLIGEAVALTLCLVPGQLLGRWTLEGKRLYARAALQAVCFSALSGGVLTALVLDRTYPGGALGTFRELVPAPGGRPAWLTGLLLQLLAPAAVLGLSAVQEFAQRGRGTPFPYDPPLHLVTSGPYAYVANPMQLGMTLLLAGWGALLGSPWIVAAALVSAAYSAGIAAWDEHGDLSRRFGAPWRHYRSEVHAWRPRWRPYVPPGPPARLYLAADCDPCSQVGSWLARRRPVGLALLPASAFPGAPLSRITYVGAEGTYREAGVAALARALEHLALPWALAGWTLRLPVVLQLTQVLVDASGGGPRHTSLESQLEPARTSSKAS